MEVGTAETLEDIEPVRKRMTGLTGGSNAGNGGRHPGGGGNDDGSDSDLQDLDTGFSPNKSRILMWFLLLVVLMTFGGLIAAYVVIATNGAAEWKPFALPVQVWISTVLILISSVTYFAGHRAIEGHDQIGRASCRERV